MKSVFNTPLFDVSSISVSLSEIMGWLGAISLVTFTLSLLLVPLLIKHIPPDYFINLTNGTRRKFHPTPFQISVLLLRNILGAVLFVAGFAMLFLPGQGLLTILLSLLLLTFPGKKQLTALIVRQEKVRKSINWIREKVDATPIIWPDDH